MSGGWGKGPKGGGQTTSFDGKKEETSLPSCGERRGRHAASKGKTVKVIKKRRKQTTVGFSPSNKLGEPRGRV